MKAAKIARPNAGEENKKTLYIEGFLKLKNEKPINSQGYNF
jgi:hypothetical protein